MRSTFTRAEAIIKAHISLRKDAGKRVIAGEEKSLAKAEVWRNTVKWKVKKKKKQTAILIKAEALIDGTNSSQRYSRHRQVQRVNMTS